MRGCGFMRSCGGVRIPWQSGSADAFPSERNLLPSSKSSRSHSQVTSFSDHIYGEQPKDNRGGEQAHRAEQREPAEGAGGPESSSHLKPCGHSASTDGKSKAGPWLARLQRP